MSTFHGLEMAKRALSAQQAAIYTTGNNISNAHTEGYSRQRVKFESDVPYPSASRNRPALPGQMGTGVKIGSVERIRNEFLDIQFRSENSRAGYWNTQKANLSRIEDLLNEPSDSGLSKTMKQFWQSLNDLAVNPENSGARSVVKERGIAVVETFNHLSKTLQSIRTDLKNEIKVTEDRANTLLKDINDINVQIKRIEPHGYLANDLYDERDRLIDELSSIVNIKVNKHPSGGGSLPTAEGVVSIELVDNKGGSLNDPKILLINGEADDLSNAVNEIQINFSDEDDAKVTSLTVDGYSDNIAFDRLKEVGSLMGLVDIYGYDGQPDTKTSVPKLLEELDKMAAAFAEEFNRVHRMDGEQNFFTNIDSASTIAVDSAIINDTSLINANTDDTDGNGDNALALADVFDEPLDELNGQSVNSFFQSIIGDLGVAAEESLRRTDNTNVLLSQVEVQRMSVSAVSLDEEMTNLIKFQHAYNAAARSMTSIDEMLDRIINGMGLVGR